MPSAVPSARSPALIERRHVRPNGRPLRATDDVGAAIVDFVLVGGLLVFLLAGICQVALILHVRDVAAASAAEGARFAASVGGTPRSGADRATELLRAALSRTFASALPCHASVEHRADGLSVSRVDCVGRVPPVFLPFGAVPLHVTARALLEPRR